MAYLLWCPETTVRTKAESEFLWPARQPRGVNQPVYHRPDRRCNPHRHLLDGIAYHPPSGAVLLPPGSTPPCVCLSTIEPSTSCRRPSERILSPFRLKPPGAVPLIAPLAGLRLNFVSPSSLRSSTALVLIPPIFSPETEGRQCRRHPTNHACARLLAPEYLHFATRNRYSGLQR